MPGDEGRSLSWDAAMEDQVSRAVAGDRVSFTEIYRRLYPDVAKYLYYRLGSKAQAEDVASEVFLAVWRQLPTYRGGYFPGWVFGIARNQAVGEIRKATRSRTVDLDVARDTPSQDRQPEEHVEQRENHERLHRALSQLNDQHREIVACKYLLGMSNAEVASLLGKTENAINAQQHRALGSLRRRMEKEGILDA
jgi:RNA polymerase sigma-70 factor (ECF subfamily)